MKKINVCVLGALFLLGIFTLSGCNKNEDSALQEVRLNEVVHSIFYAPQYVALEMGFFEDEGLEIILDVGNGADKSMTALLSNSADIALLGTEAGLYVYNEGEDNYPKAFAQLTQRAGNFLVSRTKEDSFRWTDLKGKSIIGGRAGGMPQLILEYLIKNNGLVIGEDIEMINNISFESTSSAFVGGVGEYTVEFEPVATTLELQNNGYIVSSLGEASGYIPYTVYMATSEFIEENPDIIQKFTNGVHKGQIWVSQHSASEIAEVCLPYFEGTDLETLTKIIERYKNQDTWKENPVFDEDGFELIQDIMEEGGVLEKRVEFENFVDNEFSKVSVENN